MISETSEKRNELADKGVNELAHLVKKWNDRLTLQNLRLCERYLNNEIHIIVQLALTGTSGQAKLCDYVAVFQYADCVTRSKVERLLPNGIGPFDVRAVLTQPFTAVSQSVHHDASHRGSANDEMSVLVDIIQLVDQPEGLAPSIIRLGSVDEFFRARIDSLYLSQKLGFVFGRDIVNGELVRLARCSAVGLNELPNQMIEGGPQVVNGIADDAGKIVREFGQDFDPKDCASRLRVLLGNDSVTVGFAKGDKSLLKIVDVMFGPFDLEPNL